MSNAPEGRGAARDTRRALLLLVVGAVVVGAALRVVAASRHVLDAPFDVAHETPNLATILLLREGRDPYAPEVYAERPFVLTLYTPLYHLLAAALPQAENPFTTPRLLAAAATLLAAGALLVAGGRGGLPAAALAASAWLLLWPVTRQGFVVKNDSLGIALSAAAVLAVARGGKGRAIAAAVLCLLAVATKQSLVAAPAACALFLALGRRRGALAFALALAGGIAALALLAHALSGPGFWFSTLRAPANPMRWASLTETAERVLRQPLAWAIPCGALALLAGRALRRPRAPRLAAPFALYAALSSAVMLATLPKIGSDTNYVLEPMLALLMAVVHAVRDVPAAALVRGRRLAATALVVLVLGAELLRAGPAEFAATDGDRRPARAAVDAAMRADVVRLAGTAEPLVLDLWTAIHTFSIQSHALVSDPLLYKLLWDTGKLEPGPLLALLRDRTIHVVMMPRGLTLAHLAPGPVRRLFEATLEHYWLAHRDAQYDYYVRS